MKPSQVILATLVLEYRGGSMRFAHAVEDDHINASFDLAGDRE
jgi:hypothetical protein